MRILAIRGARLASLEAPFEVDLSVEPLRSAGVFAIVGPTGAGKSSLLDALCLALFDTTPRLERTPRQRVDEDADDDLSGRDARTLVRRGAADAFAEADFVGVDGQRYRARWSVERGRTGRLRSAQLSLRDLGTGRSVSGTKGEVLAAIETKLGLGLAELRRAVILPQGEVAAFLDAPSDERALLLERLTGAEIFAEVSKVVHTRAADARRARENVEVTRGMLSLLDEVDVARIQDELVAMRLDGARAEERTAVLVASRDRRVALVRAMADEMDARDALEELERQRAIAELMRDDVALAERAEQVAHERTEENRAAQSHREARMRHDEEEHMRLEARETLAPLAEDLARAWEDRDALERAQRAAREVLERELEQARAASSTDTSAWAAELAELRARERAWADLARRADRIREAERVEQRAIEDGRHARALAETSASSAERLDTRALELALDATAQAARLDEARRAHVRLVAARSLETHRAHLTEGEACPLCGATEHPHARADVAPWLDASEARVSTIHLALERTRATLARVQTSVKALVREAASANARVRVADEEAARVRREREDLVRGLASMTSPYDLPIALTELERALEAERPGIESRIRTLDLEMARDRTARERVSRIEQAVRAGAEIALRERDAVALRVEAAVRAHDRAREREAALAESVERHAVGAQRMREAWETARASFERALVHAGLAREHVERVLGPDRERVRRARGELARLDHDRASARARLEEREARRAAAQAVLEDDAGPAGEALDVAITTARAARDAARRREATLEATLAHDRVVRGRADELTSAHEAAVREEARWSGLDALIGASDGKKFRAHAQSITLERLIGFANAELSHLAPRFSLARAPLAGELALSVVDRESGHLRRTVQSLSGGESFLVSLALALGLAAMTAAEGGRGSLTSSSLFLDEGLGALDPASLEIALGALEALRASGRQIAIVTHVPQVAERFAARVEVVPRGAGRSEVRVLHG